MQIEKLRELFPVTKSQVYLNNAAQCPLCIPVKQRLDEYLELAQNSPDKRPDPRPKVRKLLSELLGGKPDEYALVTSTGVGLGIVATGYPWKPGDNVVLPEYDHWNNTYPWLNLKSKGVEVRLVPMSPDFSIDPENIAKVVDKRTKIVAISAVRFTNGFRTDLKKIGQIAHDKGALLVVDGIQGAGVVPLNIEKDDIDIMAGAGLKWLLGIHGTGYLYVRKELLDRVHPVLPGMFAAENKPHELNFFPDSRRYETGTMAYALFHAWTAGLELVKETGVVNIYERVMYLTDHLGEGLKAKGMTLVTPVNNRTERSAIISFTTGSPAKNRELHTLLGEKNISVALRGENIRVSPSFFNNEEDIDKFIKEIN